MSDSRAPQRPDVADEELAAMEGGFPDHDLVEHKRYAGCSLCGRPELDHTLRRVISELRVARASIAALERVREAAEPLARFRWRINLIQWGRLREALSAAGSPKSTGGAPDESTHLPPHSR